MLAQYTVSMAGRYTAYEAKYLQWNMPFGSHLRAKRATSKKKANQKRWKNVETTERKKTCEMEGNTIESVCA